MTVVSDMEAVVIMAGRRGRLVLVVMGVAMVIVRRAMMITRDGGGQSDAGRVGDGRTEPKHGQRKQADQQGPGGRDSVRHHHDRYKRTVKAR